jgi:hypothetical protein
MLDNDNELIVGAGLLGVVGVTAGTQTVHLPENYRIESCISGHSYNVENGILTFNLGYGDTYGDVAIFSLKSIQAVSGNVELLDFDTAQIAGTPVTFDIWQNGEQVESHTVSLDSLGNFDFSVFAEGTVQIRAKASHWLAQTQSLTLPGTVNFSLINGDVNGDNAINFLDFAVLANHWLDQMP